MRQNSTLSKARLFTGALITDAKHRPAAVTVGSVVGVLIGSTAVIAPLIAMGELSVWTMLLPTVIAPVTAVIGLIIGFLITAPSYEQLEGEVDAYLGVLE